MTKQRCEKELINEIFERYVYTVAVQNPKFPSSNGVAGGIPPGRGGCLCSVPGTYVGAALPPLTKSDRRCEKVKVTRYVCGYSRGYRYPLATVRNSDYAVGTHLLIYTSKDVAIQSLQHRWVTGTGHCLCSR